MADLECVDEADCEYEEMATAICRYHTGSQGRLPGEVVLCG